MKQSIKDLMEQYIEIVNSPRNIQNRGYWERVDGWNRDLMRGIPKAPKQNVPFVIAPDNSLWSHILKVDLRDFYNNPETYLETQLRMKIFHFNNFDDNFYFTDELYIWFSVITEISFFNNKINFYADKEPWYDGHAIEDYDDLQKMQVPDFYKNGLMPKIHEYYEVFNEYAQGKLKVMFPEWVRGPYCIATHVRGMENLLMDIASEPDFVHELMKYIVICHKDWNAQRDKFLNKKSTSCKLWNDEIGSPLIGLKTYNELIFPYEKELSDYYGEISYWHSCGNTDDFLEQINKLTNLKMFNSGPWTSYEKASKVFGQKTALDICINPEKDVYEASESDMIKKLEDIKRVCSGSKYAVRSDALMLQKDLNHTLAKIKQWNQAAIKVFRT